MRDESAGPEDEARIRERIEQGLLALFGRAESEPVDQLTRLVQLLVQWGARMNLTGHRDALGMTDRLILDAAGLVAAVPELSQAADLADLGSGAGFPGLPIAILCPSLSVHLIEAREKRHHFQREARRQLGLPNVTPIHGRSDRIEARPCGVAVAQAMTQPALAIAQMRAWTRPGGLMILPASAGSDRPPMPDGHPIEERIYRVPLLGLERRLLIVRR